MTPRTDTVGVLAAHTSPRRLPYEPVRTLRRFNRFYTARIGGLGGGHLGTRDLEAVL